MSHIGPILDCIVIVVGWLVAGWNLQSVYYGIRRMIDEPDSFSHQDFRAWSVSVGCAIASTVVVGSQMINWFRYP